MYDPFPNGYLLNYKLHEEKSHIYLAPYSSPWTYSNAWNTGTQPHEVRQLSSQTFPRVLTHISEVKE